MAGDSFVHLHVHTEYSMLDGAAKIAKLAARAKDLGMPAAAMTDHGNMFGAYEFQKTVTAAGLTPIIGIEAYVAPKSRFHKEPVWGNPDGTVTRGTMNVILCARCDHDSPDGGPLIVYLLVHQQITPGTLHECAALIQRWADSIIIPPVNMYQLEEEILTWQQGDLQDRLLADARPAAQASVPIQSGEQGPHSGRFRHPAEHTQSS